jgi:hypothetical protein
LTDTTKYTATFTLSQEGAEGDITSTLSFDPLVDRANVDQSPLVYEMMSQLVLHYLYMAEVVDEDGNLIDPAGFEDNTHLNISTFGDKSKLN